MVHVGSPSVGSTGGFTGAMTVNGDFLGKADTVIFDGRSFIGPSIDNTIVYTPDAIDPANGTVVVNGSDT